MSNTSATTMSKPRLAGSGFALLAAAFGLFAVGDRSVWSAGAGNGGVDPLEILNLAVRPNAIFVLDSSGSMGETVTGVGGLADDDPAAKIAIAKKVIRDVVAANQTRVSFQFGTYNQPATTIARIPIPPSVVPLAPQTTQSTGSSKFQYTATNPAFTTEPAVQLRLFEVPAGSNWTVTFKNGATQYVTTSLPTGTYTGTEFAQLIAGLMNAQDNSGYVGTFTDPAISANPTFSFARTLGTNQFMIRFSLMNATLNALLRANATDNDRTVPLNPTPLTIVPQTGLVTSFSATYPNSFVVAAGPTIRFRRGSATFTTTLTNATYSGAGLASHIATRMNAIDPGAGAGVPNSFVITGSPSVRIAKGPTPTLFTGNLTDGTYTGAALATHIATVFDAIDGLSATTSTYTGIYNTGTGVFTFGRIGSGGPLPPADTTSSFSIRWSNWNASLRTLIGAPSADATDASNPFSLVTSGLGAGGVATYAGAYSTATGLFTFTRAGSDTLNSFDILLSSWTGTLRTLMGVAGADVSDPLSPYTLTLGPPTTLLPPGTASSQASNTGPGNSTAPLVLYRRADLGSPHQISDLGSTFYSLFANKFFNGQILSVLADGSPCFLQAGVPIVGPAKPTVTIAVVPSCGGAPTTSVVFPLQGPTTVSTQAGVPTCGGFRSLVALAPCDQNDQLTTIDLPYLQNDFNYTGTTINGYSETNGTGTSVTQPPDWGVRAAGSTPIAESLIDIATIFKSGTLATAGPPALPAVSAIWPGIALQTKKQTTFVIFVTDGDDTCQDRNGSNLGLSGDQQALRAAHKTQLLRQGYQPGDLGWAPNPAPTETADDVTTYFVAFGSGAAANRSNWIAWGGSGMILPTTGTLAQTRWSAIPTAAQRAACTTCVDAFLATDAAALTAALQAAIDLGQSAGEFSDQQSITETVYEYGYLVPLPTPTPTPSPAPSVTPAPTPVPLQVLPLSPRTRYGSTIPVLLQSTFEMPAFSGHLKAFRNNSGVSELLWDAGAKLNDRVTNDTGAMGLGTYTFDQLHGGATAANIKTSSARIKRRIFTTTGQGVLAAYGAPNLLSANAAALAGTAASDPIRVELWPPTTSGPTAVAPSANNPAPAGRLDTALGLTAATTLVQVQALSPTACKPSGDATPRLHPECTSVTPGVALARAKREAREAILASLAGAKVLTTNGAPDRLITGEVLFTARPWILSESTLAAPAVVTPPLVASPLSFKSAEYLLYRDGPRDPSNGRAVDATKNGLGLRNPDLDPLAVAGDADFRLNLKPQMSVVYHATNQGLHAFRAGPCPSNTGNPAIGPGSGPNCGGGPAAGTPLGTGPEQGGEELWAFIPFDQLGKLAGLLQIQSRSNKIYIIAAPVRVSDVFVDGGATLSLPGASVGVTGVWRTLAIFGRGQGGKAMTALDITVPGPFTEHSLTTAPPIVVWSRGNFDTNDGLIKSGSNLYNNGASDYNAFLGMGETWSVPAVGFVDPVLYPTPRRPSGFDFALFMGSGYSDSILEGRTFFVLDALSGDVFRSFALPNGTTATVVPQTGLPLANVLPVSPAIYGVDGTGASPTGFGFLANPVEARAKAVYFGDLHSRIWRYLADTPTVAPTVLADLSSDGDQPFSNGLSILEVGKVPQLFTSSGRDSRVALRPGPPRFRMYGYNDGPSGAPVGPLTQLFFRDFLDGYRGNSAPAATFAGGDLDNDPTTPITLTPVVFFTGLKYNPGGVTCVSSFDSILFALQGLTGLAAFDLNSTSNVESDDAYAQVLGQILQNPHVTTEGTLVVDRGLGAQAAPPPPAPPELQALPPQSTTTNTVYAGLTPGSLAYTTLRATNPLPLRNGSAVCNVNN